MNDIEQYKRSNEPIFWGLFGFGGMVIALAFPALLICLLIAGLTDGIQGFHILGIMSHWWGCAALFLIVMGVAFHCVHRIYFSLHDLGCHTGLALKIILYGLASIVTAASGIMLGIYYFSGF